MTSDSNGSLLSGSRMRLAASCKDTPCRKLGHRVCSSHGETCVFVGACWNTDSPYACSISRASRIFQTSFAIAAFCGPILSGLEPTFEACYSGRSIRNPELPGPDRKKRWNLTASQGGLSPKCALSSRSRTARDSEHLRPPRLLLSSACVML
jgi:hypothetical protein